MKKKNIWLLSAYQAKSHSYWADWLINSFPEFNWSLLELPGRYFNWRIRGNPLSWLNSLPEVTPDLIIATSMVDLATIKGLHPRIANCRTIYYFHENQFAYPINSNQFESVEPQMVQLYGALSSNLIVFNTKYNKSSFMNGLEKLIKKLPDHIPGNLFDSLESKSVVVPVPIQLIKPGKKNNELILWNHRWEYDKAPNIFLDFLNRVDEKNIPFQLALLGSRPKKAPFELNEIRSRFRNHILFDGMVSKHEYQSILGQAKVVVSTSLHEFQGLSMLEAVSAGAIPLAPNHLCYPEIFDEKYLYQPFDLDQMIELLLLALQQKETPKINLSHFDEVTIKKQWVDLINSSEK